MDRFWWFGGSAECGQHAAIDKGIRMVDALCIASGTILHEITSIDDAQRCSWIGDVAPAIKEFIIWGVEFTLIKNSSMLGPYSNASLRQLNDVLWEGIWRKKRYLKGECSIDELRSSIDSISDAIRIIGWANDYSYIDHISVVSIIYNFVSSSINELIRCNFVWKLLSANFDAYDNYMPQCGPDSAIDLFNCKLLNIVDSYRHSSVEQLRLF